MFLTTLQHNPLEFLKNIQYFRLIDCIVYTLQLRISSSHTSSMSDYDDDEGDCDASQGPLSFMRTYTSTTVSCEYYTSTTVSMFN